jgi:uncharacterized protein
VILVAANLLLYAEDSRSLRHASARTWWDQQLSGNQPVNLCWPLINAFIRIGTNVRLHERPLTIEEASARVESWFNQPCVILVQPTDQHWCIFQGLMAEAQAVGNLVSDAHLAALAIEHNCTMQSPDSDFVRFPDLKWNNPIADFESRQSEGK